jgi:hypothetical protein
MNRRQAKAHAEIHRRPEVEATLRSLADDVQSTSGWSAQRAWRFVLREAGLLLDWMDDGDWPFEQRVIENTQQRMHDEFIDRHGRCVPSTGRILCGSQKSGLGVGCAMTSASCSAN